MRITIAGSVVAGAVAAAVFAGAWTQAAPPPLSAQQVVANSLAARGGATAFAAVRTLSFTGHLQLAGGQTAALVVWLASHPSRIRIELTLPAGKLVQGFDGFHAWQVAPGQSQAVPLAGAAATQLEDQALGFVDLLADPDAHVALAGSGADAGRAYYKVAVTLASGDVFTQYVDAHTWLAYHEEYPGGVEDISDYRRVQGLRMPFRYRSGPVGQPATVLVRDAVTLNPPLPSRLFAQP